MPQVDVNFVAVLVAAVLNMVIGFLWYGPFFGKAWIRAMGWKDMDDFQKEKKNTNMAKTYGIAALAGLVMAYVLAVFVALTNANTLTAGVQLGFWIWLGFIATKSLDDVVFEGKSWSLYYIAMGYRLTTFLVMGAILASWK